MNRDNKHFSALEGLFTSHQSSDKNFFLVNEEGGVSILAWNYFVNGFTDKRVVEWGMLKEIKPSFIYVKNGFGQYFKDKAVWQINSKVALERIINEPRFVKELAMPRSLEKGELAFTLFTEVRNGINDMTPERAVELLGEFNDIITTQIALNHVAVFDLIGNPLSNYLKKYLDNQVLGTQLKTGVAMEKLLMPTQLTNTQLLKKDLLILAIANKNGDKDAKKSLLSIWEDWKWLNYGYRGPVFEQSYLQQMLAELEAKALIDLQAELAKINTFELDIAREKERMFKKLKIDQKHREFIEALSDLSYLKVYRKDIAFLLIYLTHEILSKFNTFSKPHLIHNLTLGEAKDFISGRLKVTERELTMREKGAIYHSADQTVLVGDQGQRYLEENVEKSEEDIDGNIKLLEGMTASLGETGDWVYGTVKIVNGPKDMAKMNEGDILISVATTPDILLAMKKASAIVTDHGGITCHAAIVSRELNIPCLIATKYATKVFKDGDQVVMCPRHSYIKFQ